MNKEEKTPSQPSKPKSFFKLWIVFLIGFGGVAFLLASRVADGWTQFPESVKATLNVALPSLELGSLTSEGNPPDQLVVSELALPNPFGFAEKPAFAASEFRMNFSPWGWGLGRVLIGEAVLDSPILNYERDAQGQTNLNAISSMASEAGGGAPLKLPIIPKKLTFQNGRLNLIDRELKPDGVIIPMGGLTGLFEINVGEPSVLELSGNFLDDQDQPVGEILVDFDITSSPKGAKGQIRFEHRDLRLLQAYLTGRTPYRLLGGQGIADSHLTYQGDGNVRIELDLMARDMEIEGEGDVAGVPFAQFIDGLRDSDGSIHFALVIEGDVNDPTFQFHDHLVRRLEEAMIAKLKTKGIKLQWDPTMREAFPQTSNLGVIDELPN